ncbi:MAG: alpha/beta hydrolase fold domain-containing protein [Actinomycetota bacterium]
MPESNDEVGTDTDSTADGDVGVDVDVVVVGAGFAGLYLLHRLRGLGLSAQGFETGDDVGGTWYWNRYPGARCDIQSVDYSYSFDPELEKEWEWSEKYATQPEILRYVDHVATRHDLRRDIRFSTSIDAARWDEDNHRWLLTTSEGDTVRSRFYVMATGCLSQPKQIDIDGAENFGGEVYSTSRWPHDGVDLTGKRVAVIGTGSSGVQSIPIMADQCDAMTVYQRTPNFAIPARNGPTPQWKLDEYAGREAEYRNDAKWSRAGVPREPATEFALLATEEERQTRYERVWHEGELVGAGSSFADLMVNEDANQTFVDFLHGKIRSIVTDPETAAKLCPTDHPVGSKRICLETDYYATFNKPHVDLVDLRANPIVEITETGITTSDGPTEFDVIVYATGFDAMTGAIVAVDIEGRDGQSLADKWADGPLTYLGLTVAGFPNFFTITGPGSPSVLSNMMVSIEQHVDWIGDCIVDLRDRGATSIEAAPQAESAWVQYVNDAANITLFPQANSWYMGANVPGKPRVFLPFVGGVGAYRQTCNEVRELDYLGFIRRDRTGGVSHAVGVIRPLQPDVTAVLAAMAELELPPLETLGHEGARAFMEATAEQRPPGPEVGEVVDGTFPGPAGDLNYRLYRPADRDSNKKGPHPLVVYYHGGGWVLGNHMSDDPFCRDLCVRSGAAVLSVDYRHAPEAPFPAAVDDAVAALSWAADNAAALGADPDRIAVAGWSAGANLAAVVCQAARDSGGPRIAGQLLVTPVTNHDPASPSLAENAEGYVLTRSLMEWFWDQYAEPDDRTDPRASPLRGELEDLPPAYVVTSQFDPLRDEGRAYADALQSAGNKVAHRSARGHIHTSLHAVNVVISGAPIRADMAEAVRGFFA